MMTNQAALSVRVESTMPSGAVPLPLITPLITPQELHVSWDRVGHSNSDGAAWEESCDTQVELGEGSRYQIAVIADGFRK